MVSDALTVTAFIVLMTMKLLPVISETSEGIRIINSKLTF